MSHLDRFCSSIDVLTEEGVSLVAGVVKNEDLNQARLLAALLGARVTDLVDSYSTDHLRNLGSNNRIPDRGAVLYLVGATRTLDIKPHPPHIVFMYEQEQALRSGFAHRFLPIVVARPDSYTWDSGRQCVDRHGFDELRDMIISAHGIFLCVREQAFARPVADQLGHLQRLNGVGLGF